MENTNTNNNLPITALQSAQLKLNKDTEELVTGIVDSQDTAKLQDLTNLFNLAQTKKAVLRAQTYSDLLDGITEQMTQRVQKRADQFSNKDLLDYMNVITNAAEKAQKQIAGVDQIPMIQVNTQNNTVVVGEQFDKDSRQRILAAANSLLEKLKANGGQVSSEIVKTLQSTAATTVKELKPEDELENAQIIIEDEKNTEVKETSVYYDVENSDSSQVISFNTEDEF